MNSKRLQSAFWLLSAVSGWAALFATLAIPADPKNALVFGFSAARLFLTLVIFLMTLFACYMIRDARQQAGLSRYFFDFLDRYQRTLRIPLAFVILLSTLFFRIPAERFNAFQFHRQRLLPLIVWLSVFVLQVLLCIVLQHGTGWRRVREDWHNRKTNLWTSSLVFLGFVAIWIFVLATGFGVTLDVHWNEGSVPLLGFQVWLSIFLGSLVLIAEKRMKGKAWLCHPDLWIMAAIWVGTVLVWQSQPILHSYMLPEPTAPNYEFYTFSDAATYDIGGRYLALGQGINNLRSTDKPFYIFLLGIFQIISGWKYENIVGVQTLLLGFLPVLLYHLGRRLHSRPAGVLIACLAVFREVNAIRATLDLQVSHSKLLLTELPTALFLALLAVFLVEWQHRSNETTRAKWLLWAAGAAGLAALTRPNAYLVFAVVILLLFLYQNKLKSKLVNAAIFALGFSLIVLPWFVSGPSGRSVLSKLRFITDLRYGMVVEEADIVAQDSPVPIQTAVPDERDSARLQPFMLSHFLHNLVGTSLVFPVDTVFQDIRTTVRVPRWDQDWNGHLPAAATALMGFNLLLVAVGIGFSQKKGSQAGWIPAVIFGAYHLSNALVRTSGGRYLVPVEWAAVVYYGVGLTQLAQWTISWLQGTAFDAGSQAVWERTYLPHIRRQPLWSVALILLLIGISMPLSALVIPNRLIYPDKAAAWQVLLDTGMLDALENAGINPEEFQTLLEDDSVFIYHGLALNPRYVLGTEEIPQLTFIGIGAYTVEAVLPLQADPGYFPQGSEIYLVGCADAAREAFIRRGRSSQSLPIRALLVVLDTRAGEAYYFSSELSTTAACPEQ